MMELDSKIPKRGCPDGYCNVRYVYAVIWFNKWFRRIDTVLGMTLYSFLSNKFMLTPFHNLGNRVGVDFWQTLPLETERIEFLIAYDITIQYYTRAPHFSSTSLLQNFWSFSLLIHYFIQQLTTSCVLYWDLQVCLNGLPVFGYHCHKSYLKDKLYFLQGKLFWANHFC